MKRLSVRLSLAFLLSAWIGIGAMILVVQRTLDSGFRHYVTIRDGEANPEQITRLENYYAANSTWTGANTVLTGRSAGVSGAGRGATISVADLDGMIIVSTDAAQVGSALTPEALSTAIPLTVKDQQVGWLVRQSPGIQALGAAEVAFLDESNRWLTLAGLGATALALVVGSVFAWTLSRPLRELTRAARDLTIGQLGRQVDIRGTLEVDALAAEFNTMSKALAEAETLRQRMAADVAHELRTPVSVLRGHLEAMLDGLYPLDSAHVAVAHDQTIHLARLVEDLRVLTLAEARRLPLEHARLNPVVLVEQVLEAFDPLALDGNIHLKRAIPSHLPDIFGDMTRLRQVLSNLLTNAMRHTPDGGEIKVEIVPLASSLHFSVANTGSWLDETDAARVFQPFFRARSASEKDKGGSGLGLAISYEIIRLHGGTMTVESRDNQVTFEFTLPCEG